MGLAINIRDDTPDEVKAVYFESDEGWQFSITKCHRNDDLLFLHQDSGENIKFPRHEIDEMIKLLQAAKKYEI